MTVAYCPACRLPMSRTSCDAFAWRAPDGTLTPRQRAEAECHDCLAPRGAWHHAGCDADLCPHGQALMCDLCTLAVPERFQ